MNTTHARYPIAVLGGILILTLAHLAQGEHKIILNNIAVAPGNPAMVGPQSTSGMAVAGFVLGLLSLLLLWVPFLGLLLGILGLVFSGTGLSAIRRSGGTLGGKGLAVAGLVLSILGVLV
jgi:hypothetical protein